MRLALPDSSSPWYSSSGVSVLVGTPVGPDICLYAHISLGVNEFGIEEVNSDPVTVRHRRELTNDLVREMLQLFDVHAIFRKPTFDGVRAVMLILPLTEGALLHGISISRFSPLFSPARRCPVAGGEAGTYLAISAPPTH